MSAIYILISIPGLLLHVFVAVPSVVDHQLTCTKCCQKCEKKIDVKIKIFINFGTVAILRMISNSLFCCYTISGDRSLHNHLQNSTNDLQASKCQDFWGSGQPKIPKKIDKSFYNCERFQISDFINQRNAANLKYPCNLIGIRGIKRLKGDLGRIAVIGSYRIWLARNSQEWSPGELIKVS